MTDFTSNWDDTSRNPRDDFERAKKIIKADTSWKPPDVFLLGHQAELLGLGRRTCFVKPHYFAELVNKYLKGDD